MKKATIIWSLSLLFHMSGFAQGMIFFQGTWEQAMEKALAEEKPIFVDAYTTWCGPCKMMSQRVFPEPRVGALYNANFVAIKIDMEQPEGIRFQEKYPVSAYPTLLYIDGNGKLLKRVVGAQQADAMLQLGKNVLESFTQSSELAAAYEQGARDPELIYKYIRSLNRAGKSSLRVANDYLRTQSDLRSDANLKIIFEAAIESDSRIFDLLLQHRTELNRMFSTQKVDMRIYEACMRTGLKAQELNSQQLLEEVIAKMKQYLPVRAKAFTYLMEMEQAGRLNDEKGYVKALGLYVKSATSEPADSLRQTAQTISIRYGNNPEILQAVADLLGLAEEKEKHIEKSK